MLPQRLRLSGVLRSSSSIGWHGRVARIEVVRSVFIFDNQSDGASTEVDLGYDDMPLPMI